MFVCPMRSPGGQSDLPARCRGGEIQREGRESQGGERGVGEKERHWRRKKMVRSGRAMEAQDLYEEARLFDPPPCHRLRALRIGYWLPAQDEATLQRPPELRKSECARKTRVSGIWRGEKEFSCCCVTKRRTLKDTEKRQKLPINENTNFNIILNQHNPSRERDCHFLVSMKKSKKERKGTRKRSPEAENADDDDSASSRGDLSPSDERPKSSSGKEESILPEDSSPIPLHRPSSPVIEPAAHSNGQVSSSNGTSPNAKTHSVDGHKVERTLLRREGMGQNGFASPRAGWHNGSGVGSHRIEGFSVSSTVKVENRPHLQSQHGSNGQQLDHRKLEHRASENGSTPGRPAKATLSAAAQPPERLIVPRVDVSHQERFSDAVPQASPVLRNGIVGPAVSPTSPSIGRNGVAAVVPVGSGGQGQARNGGFATSPTGSRANSVPPAANGRPSISTIVAAGNFMPRVMNGSAATGASGTNGVSLQQAHLLHSLHQQHASQMSMTPLEFSKFSGVLRGLVGESSKVCRVCFSYAERNIRPAPFHSCVHDRIVAGFRGPSPAGPIGRPVKRHVEAA